MPDIPLHSMLMEPHLGVVHAGALQSQAPRLRFRAWTPWAACHGASLGRWRGRLIVAARWLPGYQSGLFRCP